MTKPLFTQLAIAIGSLAVAGGALADYPDRNIQGTIQWGAGGATDNVVRSLTPHVEEVLDTTIVLTNRPGGTGVIGMNHVMRQRPDGYNLLFGAENPQLYPLMGLADFTYDDMYPINIIGQGRVVIATHPNSPFDTFAELLEYAHENPDELKMGGTGAGGLPSTIHAMINSVDDLHVRTVTFGGDGPGVTALLGEHIDFMPLSLSAVAEQIRAGRLKGLAVLGSEELEDLPDVPPITDAIPELDSFLPWGPFWGVFVREDTPDDVKATLEDAYEQAVASDGFQEFLANFGGESLNLNGEEAQQYLDNWQSVTAWSMFEADAVEKSPEELGIPRP
ncbi:MULTISPECIES: tripartite tricarboxylate transporter substrate binding protein [unclassified Halomonas]|uniref:tripartite tricarboxylate transporter substrate binding protein n=1 Tax=unclassified Halomonas TaxID=2609666 RepID=UPI00047FDDAC|nr:MULTISPECIES: tripartite tricarboxylate transporter substrate binding protein [unclassified Halomonas]PKH58097.1 tripartite tricarboxylate transporter substrate binding protein [Halomonas sp. Choline-3u-9]QGQ71056.1 tripartite tricarboxylate transporter substrate binding protein [Halomonas sp. PA16-9]|tara:strand:- start:4302 stop:5303 length:1002 start_codon:yes stop_codon:yes gene_type:complete